MSTDNHSSAKTCKLVHMLMYAFGECATSLVLNGINGFLMLYYTKALGLNPKWAGIAISVSIFWEAVSEPVMGHISDNTRSRFGRRHAYILIGGLLMAGFFYLIWGVPQVFLGSNLVLFSYLVVMNLLLRTGITVFFIPYMALGFEMCGDYQGRSKIQSLRFIFSMIANIAGPAMAWKIFFNDAHGVQATTVPGNYVLMGGVFAVVTAVVVLLVTVITYRWHEDTRAVVSKLTGGRAVRDFIADMKQIILDPNPRWVFIFTFIVCVGMVLVSTLQMYVYDDFMRFSADQKFIAHGSTMLGAGIGSAVAIFLSRLFDKKGTVIFGSAISIVGNLMLCILFLTGLLPKDAVWSVGGFALPIALILFVVFHAAYWLGNGMLLPIATAMMADAAEIHQIQTGENKDGGYSSVFSLAMRMAIAFSAIVSGFCLDWIGYKVPDAGKAVFQSPHTLWWLGAITFVVGTLIAIAALLAIRNYRIDRRFIEELRSAK
jgi:GPH family glycoside/pentoside/hexuronide:cation symporter